MIDIVVTGANKGIGLAVVEATLREQPDVKVWLGCRSLANGEAARAGLIDLDASFATRVEVLELDANMGLGAAVRAGLDSA